MPHPCERSEQDAAGVYSIRRRPGALLGARAVDVTGERTAANERRAVGAPLAVTKQRC
jgi:hypothetical protein